MSLAEIPVSWSVGNVELSPNGQLLYVNTPDRVYVINTVTNTGITSFQIGGMPADVAFSEDSTQAYITNLQSGELYVIDTATNAVIAKPVIDTTGLPVINPNGTPGTKPDSPPTSR